MSLHQSGSLSFYVAFLAIQKLPVLVCGEVEFPVGSIKLTTIVGLMRLMFPHRPRWDDIK
jgi:amino acid permease